MRYFLLVTTLLCGNIYADEPQVKNFGWTAPAQGTDLSTDHKFRISSLRVWSDEDDSLNYKFLYKALVDSGQASQNEITSGRIDSLNQGSVGSCVGYSLTNATEVTAAANVYHRKQLRQIWLSRLNPDAMYGITRYENLGRWDGSTGAWASANIAKYGTLHSKVYGSFDLTNTRPTQGRTWAAQGLPRELIEAAKAHRALSCEKVTTVEQAKAVLQNGYGIITCAQASYPNRRDANGFSRRSGRAWAHAMSVIAYRGTKSGKEGYLIQNSWGNTWNNGGIYPADQPHGSFWVTAQDLQYHLSQGDSYAIGGYEGFKRKKVTWKEVFTGKE